MKTYAPVTEAVLDALKTIVGAEYVLTEPEKLEQYQTDEETDPRKFHLPEAVVLPKDAQEIAAVIKLANTYDVPVSRGSRYSYCASCTCSRPSFVRARWAKISRMSPLRSTTRTPKISSRARPWAGERSSSKMTTPAPAAWASAAMSAALPRPT